jgi:cyclohexanone monooxygenase
MSDPAGTVVDALIVGAGFAGLYSVYKLRELGFSVLGFEAAPDVGGVWYWNRYPGARCDVESMQYSFGFSNELQQEWAWTERFAAQPEILCYINHVADRFGLRPHIRFGARVVTARFDAEAALWTLTTASGDTARGRFLIMASGGLSVPRLPDIPGIDQFRGPILHTGTWPANAPDLTGLRVGVVGTGSSGVQAIPRIAAVASHTTVFQRTANFVIPARNAPLAAEAQARWKSQYPQMRARAKQVGTFYEFSDRSALSVSDAERQAEFDRRWTEGGVNFIHAFNDLATNEAANATAADYVRARIRETVSDPETAEALCPKDHPIGSKRIVVGSEYFETYNRPNVRLVDLRSDPIVSVTADGVTTQGAIHQLDVMVLATGYDALTGALSEIDIRGCNGVSLRDLWAAGPRTYLGLMSNGFPNLFIITGPGSPSVLVNMIVGIEQHVEWISDLLVSMRADGRRTIEPKLQAQDDWVTHVNDEAARTLFVKANSWYLGANIPGKPRVFMPYVGGIGRYRAKCDQVATAGYDGFAFSGSTE